jgi:hypothetical protein
MRSTQRSQRSRVGPAWNRRQIATCNVTRAARLIASESMPLQLTQLRRDVTGEFVARPRKNAADAGGAANSDQGLVRCIENVKGTRVDAPGHENSEEFLRRQHFPSLCDLEMLPGREHVVKQDDSLPGRNSKLRSIERGDTVAGKLGVDVPRGTLEYRLTSRP